MCCLFNVNACHDLSLKLKSSYDNFVQYRGQKNLVRVCNDPPVVMSPSTKNPYAHPPGSQGGGFAYSSGFYRALDEYDDVSHMPQGLDVLVWERLIEYRRNKVDLEQEVIK